MFVKAVRNIGSDTAAYLVRNPAECRRWAVVSRGRSHVTDPREAADQSHLAAAGTAAARSATSALRPRAQRTREAIVVAAGDVFAGNGYAGTRIADIAARAGVSSASFYTYFQSKEQIFREVIRRLQVEMARRDGHQPARADAIAGIEASNRAYIRSYRRNAALMVALEQVAPFDAGLRQLRLELRGPVVRRGESAVRAWQQQGLADPDLDARYAATALGNMVDRFAYVWLVLGEDFEEDQAVHTLTQLWVRALGMNHRVSQRPRTGGDTTLRCE